MPLRRPFLAKDEQARGDASTVEDVEWERDNGVDEPRLKQRLPYQVLIIRLASFVLWASVVI